MIWTKDKILQTLKRLHKEGKDISYNKLARKMQAVVSAAAYHFGSYRKAVERAGIDYAVVLRRPRWTRQHIIAAIKKGKRDGHDLHWAAVTKRRDELGRAAFASLQKRLFGTWDRALQAAGLDSDEISRYRRWDKTSILYEIKTLSREGELVNSGAMQASEPGLHAAAVRHFGSYNKTLKLAGIDPASVRQRRTWTKDEVLKGIRAAGKKGGALSDSAIRKTNPALYGAAVRLFGTFTKARLASGVKWTRAKRK